MIKRCILLLIPVLSLNLLICKGQVDGVYEIPFSMEKKLLVFKGQLNGIETNFAFDTGAAEGIANTNNEKSNGVERRGPTQRISDGNGKIAYLQSATTKKLSIGGYTFENVRVSITDMQFLYCMDLYLLGADVIRKLNWEIDFEKMILKVSKNKFETPEGLMVIPVHYKYNTPRTKLTIGDINFNDVLIDIGYNGVMTIPSTNEKVKNLLETKRQKQRLVSKMSSSFAAAGLPKPSLIETILVDSININSHYYRQIPADFSENTDAKIGLSFFSSICERLIINNTENKYYIQVKAKGDFKSYFPVSVLLKDGKLKIISATVYADPVDNIFIIDEEVKSVNGKSAADFKSECDYLNWYYLSTYETLTIEKLSGQKVDLQRSPNR